MEEFWGRHYGPARKVAIQALGRFFVVALGYFLLTTFASGLPRFVGLGVLIVGLVPVIIFMTRYIKTEVRAIRAALRDDKEHSRQG